MLIGISLRLTYNDRGPFVIVKHFAKAPVIEVEVHQQLRQLQQSLETFWPHQLTMARMVARGLRLQRSALIQVPDGGQHRLSYLLPALMWPGPTLLCAPESVQAQILHEEIPFLQHSLGLTKPVLQASTWPGDEFVGLLLVDPHVWLHDRLRSHPLVGTFDQAVHFPPTIPLLLDGAEHLEHWIDQALTVSITPADWHRLQRALPALDPIIAATHVNLTMALLRRPLPRFLLHSDETNLLMDLVQAIPADQTGLPPIWAEFLQKRSVPSTVLWAEVKRETSQFILHLSLAEVRSILTPLWQTQPIVIIGEALDLDRDAQTYRRRLGLPDLTPLRFLPESSGHRSRPDQILQLYLPKLPLPNDPRFRDDLITELKWMLCWTTRSSVILVSDQPLQTQVGTALAAEFGSRVKVNGPSAHPKGILVCSWDHWLEYKTHLPNPDLMVIATLPFPSMDDPLVAGRVQYLQRTKQDWFRIYLLPTAAAYLQRATAPLRGQRSPQADDDLTGTVAILDSRIVTRSYGRQLLEALSPTARIQCNPRYLGSGVSSYP